MRTHQEKFDSYMRSPYVKHYPGVIDLWEVRGEDENADLAGTHHQPFIALCRGKYEDVVHWAVEHPRFYSWGSGGLITKKNKRISLKLGLTHGNIKQTKNLEFGNSKMKFRN